MFTRRLGGVEVSAWALMGILWEIFEAFAEGYGDAAAVRVSCYMSENLPIVAQQLSYKVVLLSTIVALMLSSIFLMVGPNLVVSLSGDRVLQNVMIDLVPITALALVSVTLAQTFWNLMGAQGRFGLASGTVLGCRWLVSMPISFISIFAYQYDVVSLGAAIAVGYITAAFILAGCLRRSDWKGLAAAMVAQSNEADEIALEDLGFDPDLLDESDSEEDDDSDDFL